MKEQRDANKRGEKREGRKPDEMSCDNKKQ